MKILMIPSSASELRLASGRVLPTGFWAQEFVPPWQVFHHAGLEIDIATVGGHPAALDETCLAPEFHDGDLQRIEALKRGLAAIPGWRQPLPLATALAQVDRYAAVFFPGGHGPQADLAMDRDCGRLLEKILRQGGLIGAVCHGPAAFLAAPQAPWLFNGYRMTCFSAEDERLAGLADELDWLLAERLSALGGQLSFAAPGQAHVVADRQLLTGQNPASVELLAQQMLAALHHPAAPERTL